jgi:hypothetical protein
MRLRALALSCALLLLPFPLLADTVYTYNGNPLTEVQFGTLVGTPYSTNDSITGWFSLPSVLSPNLVLSSTPITPTTFNFTDGVTSYTSGVGLAFVSVSTDSLGNLTSWYVALFNDPAYDVEAVIFGSPTAGQGGDSISSTPYQLVLGNQNDPGTWSVSDTARSPNPRPSACSQPAPSS